MWNYFFLDLKDRPGNLRAEAPAERASVVPLRPERRGWADSTRSWEDPPEPRGLKETPVPGLELPLAGAQQRVAPGAGASEEEASVLLPIKLHDLGCRE
ncbi:uncharacterized protein LOC128583189 isoform X2 [Nycticebus coucang]|uniref:uncharacterized protein LOC128583189 isoform X2 n=1 Tax=Nycticebus coucang TaxID=9470 RepID=UPI00234C8004|nr:uncharacterized protein LOC128583189 isoform X2 [Nycticebus coucang]